MVSNIFIVNKNGTRIGLFLSISGFIVIFKHVSNIALVSILLVLNMYLPVGVVPGNRECFLKRYKI